MDVIHIRCAREDDYDAIVAVWQASGSDVELQGRESRESFAFQLRHFPDSYLVATDAAQIVGVVLGTHDHRKGWINRLAVLPEYRRRGIAADLVSACDAVLRRKGLNIVTALVEHHNQASANLFEKLGFRADVPVLYFRKL